MENFKNILSRGLSLFKAQAEYSQAKADEFRSLAQEVEEILLEQEAADNEGQNIEKFDFNAIISEFERVIANNPIDELKEISTRVFEQKNEEHEMNITLDESDRQISENQMCKELEKS